MGLERKKVAFRLDGASFMGYGHIYQGLSLADEFRCNGNEVVFVMKDHEAKALEHVREQGIEVRSISASASENEDADITLNYLEDGDAKVVIIDHHDLGYEYAARLRRNGRLVVNIDDEGKRKFCSDILINYNIYAPEINYKTDKHTELLLGPKYAMLRKQFISPPRPKSGNAGRLLITLGGGYARGEVIKVLEALRLLDKDILAKVRPQVILGAGYPEPHNVIDKYSSEYISIKCKVDNIREYMEESSFAVCGGGGTLYELSRMGVPPIIVILDDNQRMNSRYFTEAGISSELGWYEDVKAESIADNIRIWVNDKEGMRERQKRAQELVDGMGSSRIVGAILSHGQ